MEQIRIQVELSANLTEQLIDFFQSRQFFKTQLRELCYETAVFNDIRIIQLII
jgi:hypothetical protein